MPATSEPDHRSDPQSDERSLDVCISYPEGGIRNKHFFTQSTALLSTLVAWKRKGKVDILLTWGRTLPEIRERVEVLIRQAEVDYRTPEQRRGQGVTAADLARTFTAGVSRDFKFMKRLSGVGVLFLVALIFGTLAADGGWEAGDRLYFGFVSGGVCAAGALALWWSLKLRREGR